jgi:hypothetical protein
MVRSCDEALDVVHHVVWLPFVICDMEFHLLL